MRTLYFLEPGQKLKDIRPSERNRALLLTEGEWQTFGSHLVRKQRAMEMTERETSEVEDRKKMSKEMAKTWDNTIIVNIFTLIMIVHLSMANLSES